MNKTRFRLILAIVLVLMVLVIYVVAINLPIANDSANPAVTEEPAAIPAELQQLPAGVTIEKMSVCNDVGTPGSWKDDKAPFAGTQLVCGSDKYWDITMLFYKGVQYQVPVLENAVPVMDNPAQEPAVPVEVVSQQPNAINFPVPGNYSPLRNDAGELIGITYPIQGTGPYTIPSCYKCTLIVAVGKFTFSGTIANPFTGLFGASEVTGNILAGVCDNVSGCITPMIGAKSGHIQVTIVFPGYEIPNESVTWAVNFMFNPESSNCGDGCLEVYVGNFTTGVIKKFDNTITPADLDLVAPDGPYPAINIAVDGIPVAGSAVILNDAGDPIGQKYYLADKDAFISIPEDGGTVFYFGTACIRDGISQKAGDVVTIYGVKSDGGTRHDQNQTVEVKCSQPEMVLVNFIHGGNFEDELTKLKSEYPDWVWP